MSTPTRLRNDPLIPGVHGIHLYLAGPERELWIVHASGDINGYGRDELVLRFTCLG